MNVSEQPRDIKFPSEKAGPPAGMIHTEGLSVHSISNFELSHTLENIETTKNNKDWKRRL